MGFHDEEEQVGSTPTVRTKRGRRLNGKDLALPTPECGIVPRRPLHYSNK